MRILGKIDDHGLVQPQLDALARAGTGLRDANHRIGGLGEPNIEARHGDGTDAGETDAEGKACGQ